MGVMVHVITAVLRKQARISKDLIEVANILNCLKSSAQYTKFQNITVLEILDTNASKAS